MSYAGQAHTQIVATLALLRHFRAFLVSDCREMRDPFDTYSGRLDKRAAQVRLSWLVNVAINRKASIPDAVGRKQTSDYQRGLLQDAAELNRPRLRIYQLRTPELRKRFAHRIVSRYED